MAPAWSARQIKLLILLLVGAILLYDVVVYQQCAAGTADRLEDAAALISMVKTGQLSHGQLRELRTELEKNKKIEPAAADAIITRAAVTRRSIDSQRPSEVESSEVHLLSPLPRETSSTQASHEGRREITEGNSIATASKHFNEKITEPTEIPSPTPTPRHNVSGCPDVMSGSTRAIKNGQIDIARALKKCPSKGKPKNIKKVRRGVTEEKSETISSAWKIHAISIFGADAADDLSPLQWEVLQALHPLSAASSNNKRRSSSHEQHEEAESTSSKTSSGRFDFSIKYGPAATDVKEAHTSNSSSSSSSHHSNNKLCPFSHDEPLFPMHDGRFALDGYSMVKFLWKWMFQKHGWVTVPVAGTALGAYRHHGMYEHDDDMDMLIYPPLKYMLPPTLAERARWKSSPTRGGELLMQETPYFQEEKAQEEVAAAQEKAAQEAFTHQQTIGDSPKKQEDVKRLRKDWAKKRAVMPVLRRNYSWPFSDLDTWRWIYDDFHEHFLEYKKEREREDPDFDFQWELADNDFQLINKKINSNLHRTTRFENYHQNVDVDFRSCAFRYDSTNRTELRRMFFKGNPCLPNHFHVCLQPSTFLYERAVGGPASMFTLKGQKGLGQLCKCRFGPKESDSHFMLCPSNLLQFVDTWYSKWCLPSGPVQHGSQAIRTKSWND